MRIKREGEEHERVEVGVAKITWPIEISDYKTYRDIRSPRLPDYECIK